MNAEVTDPPEVAPAAVGTSDGRAIRARQIDVPVYKTVIKRSRVAFWLPPLFGFVVLGVAWNIYANGHPEVLPTTGKIWNSLTTSGGPSTYGDAFLVTIKEIAVGGSSGILLALCFAVAMAEVRLIERTLMPLMITLMVMPMVAIAPALVVAFGFGPVPKYVATAVMVFFPVLINSVAGLRNIDSRTLDVFTTVKASRWETFRYLRWPGSLPFVFAGLRIAFPLSVVGAVVAEIAAAGDGTGLGSLVETASAASNVVVTWTAIVLLCLMGVLMMALLMAIRRRVLWWDHESVLAKRK